MALNDSFGNQQAMPIPENLEVQEGGYGLSFSWKWSKLVGIIILIFAGVWNSIIIGMYISIYNSNEPGLVYLFPLLHLAVGLGLGYYGVASLINKTNVTVNKNEISIEHTPLFWPGAKTINRIDVKQLYVCEVITRNKNGYSRSYSLKGIDQNNRSFDVVKNLGRSDMAKYLEQKIESFWKIENYPVTGEFNS